MFFILGYPRSGTTMLRYILSEHPDVVIPPESQFIPELIFRIRRNSIDVNTKEGQQCIFRAMLKTKFVTENVSKYSLDIKSLEKHMKEPTVGNCISTLFEELTARVNKKVCGVKTPYYTQHLPLLAEVFPKAKFIYLVRDGRDIALSAHRIWGGGLLCRMLSWAETCQKVNGELSNTDLHERTLTVRFEDFVQEPRICLEKIVSHLDLVWNDKVLESSGINAHWWSKNPIINRRELPRKIDAKNAKKWPNQLPLSIQWAFDYFCGNTLELLGYELSNASIPCKKRVAISIQTGKYWLRNRFPDRSLNPKKWLAFYKKWYEPL